MSEIKICGECGKRNRAVMLNYCMYCRHKFEKGNNKLPLKKVKELKVIKNNQLSLF